MKWSLIFITVGFLVIVVSMVTLNLWIGHGVKKNIRHAQMHYPGTAEEALISFLQDERNTTGDRTHKAIWTLGQIRSKNALPVLRTLYLGDTEGTTCYGKHDSVLCQYEIHKALSSIEKGQLFSRERLNR